MAPNPERCRWSWENSPRYPGASSSRWGIPFFSGDGPPVASTVFGSGTGRVRARFFWRPPSATSRKTVKSGSGIAFSGLRARGFGSRTVHRGAPGWSRISIPDHRRASGVHGRDFARSETPFISLLTMGAAGRNFGSRTVRQQALSRWRTSPRERRAVPSRNWPRWAPRCSSCMGSNFGNPTVPRRAPPWYGPWTMVQAKASDGGTPLPH